MQLDQNAWLLIALLAVIALLWMKPPKDRPPLTLAELSMLVFQRRTDFELDFENVREMPGATLSVRLHCGDMSVMYHQSPEAETFDVWHQGHSGLIFTMNGDFVRVLEYIGGRRYTNPDLSSEELASVRTFAEQVRALTRA